MADLSKNAAKLLARLKEGRFYTAFEKSEPKSMQELVDAGLVTICGRVTQIVSCYVPTEDYTPYVPEKFGPVEVLAEVVDRLTPYDWDGDPCGDRGEARFYRVDEVNAVITDLRADLAEAQRLLGNARQIERNVQAAREHEFKRAVTAEAALRSQKEQQP